MKSILNIFSCCSCKEIYQNRQENEMNLNLDNISKSRAPYSKNIIESTIQTNHFPVINSYLEKDDLEIIEYPLKENQSEDENIFHKQEDKREQTFIEELAGDICVNNNIYDMLLKEKTCKYCESVYKEAYRKGYMIMDKKCIYCNRNITQRVFDEIFKSKDNSLDEDFIYEDDNGEYKKKRKTNQSGNMLIIGKDLTRKMQTNNIESEDLQYKSKRLLKLRTYNYQIPI